jgi:preprotein translocase subunit SecG
MFRVRPVLSDRPRTIRFTMLYYFALVIYVLTCFVLMLVVLLQQGKGGDIAAAFGGGSSQAAFGARAGATVLSRATTVCAVLFVFGALLLGIIGQRGPGSVIGGRVPAPVQSAPAVPAPAPAPAPPK